MLIGSLVRTYIPVVLKGAALYFCGLTKVTVEHDANRLFGVSASIIIRNAWVSVGVLRT